jgi:pilus assembly protein CpaF
VVSGGTGSGKTTLLNVLSSFIPPEERIVTIEDAAELKLAQDHVITLEAKRAKPDGKGEVTIRQLVRNSLRMRPERIIVGECRGGDCLDMLQAMNTGHDGSLTTLHANTPRDVISRMETLALMGGIDFPIRVVREQIASAIHLIVQQCRLRDGTRRIVSITEMGGMEGEKVVLQELFKFNEDGVDANGRIKGQLHAGGLRPRFLPRIEAAGFKLPLELFHPARK